MTDTLLTLKLEIIYFMVVLYYGTILQCWIIEKVMNEGGVQ